MTREEKYDFLTNKSVKVAICKMAIPTIISMLITSIYNMADSYFVSKLGSGAIGAVGVVFSLMAIIQAFGFFFGHGSGNYISRQLGNKQYSDAEQMAATGFYFAIIFGSLLLILGLIFINPLTYLLGSDDNIFPYAITYLTYILIGAPFFCSSLVMNNQLRFQGNALYAMIGMGAGSLLNILGDFILVPILKMDGAGLSTLISQIIGFILLRVGIIKSNNVKISITNFKPTKRLLLEIINGGCPSLARQGIGSISVICLNHVCKNYGTDAVAAMSVVSRIANLPFSIIIGFGQGFQPVCGFNYGAKKYDRVKEGVFFTMIVSFIVLSILSCLCYIYAKELIMFFCRTSDKINDMDLFLDVGITALRYQCVILPVAGIYSPINMMLQTMGKSIRATFLAILRQGLFYIPVLFIMSSSLEKIYFVQPISDFLTLIVSVVLAMTLIFESKKKKENIII